MGLQRSSMQIPSEVGTYFLIIVKILWASALEY